MPPGIAEIEVRRAGPEDHARVAETLGRVFADDAPWRWLLPDDSDRGRRVHAFFEAELRNHIPSRRELWVADGGDAAAIWAAPGSWRLPLSATLREAPGMVRIFGRRLPLAVRNQMRMERLHSRVPRHWYLNFLGAAPERQGRGLGSALMRPMLEHCDRERLPAYLEASSDRNMALYERHDFEVLGEFEMAGGGPLIRRMWRRPQG